jgi:D-inositol-3-phosphate glycosyltransferase
VVPNFVDTDRFVPGDRAAARAALRLPPGATILLSCAAIRRSHKRVDLLVQAFAAAEKPADNAILIVVGGREPDTDAIIAEGKAALGDAVRFMIDVPRQELVRLYQAADMFVMPSLFEMFGIVLIEALSCGLPVLCHDTPDFRYVVGPAGLYRDLTDVGSFATALTEALAEHRYVPLAAAARPHATNTFSEQIVIRQIVAMYRSAMRPAA